MGFIQSNHSVILYNNTMISFNMMEAARVNDVKRFFFASSACIYPEHKQVTEDCVALKEADAWPAAPQDACVLRGALFDLFVCCFLGGGCC
jgi:GDP-D-mannose 3',5'-epimerase